MALVAAIVGQLTLITILSVSKRNGLQPPPSDNKPITFGNELQYYDMILYESAQADPICGGLFNCVIFLARIARVVQKLM